MQFTNALCDQDTNFCHKKHKVRKLETNKQFNFIVAMQLTLFSFSLSFDAIKIGIDIFRLAVQIANKHYEGINQR